MDMTPLPSSGDIRNPIVVHADMLDDFTTQQPFGEKLMHFSRLRFRCDGVAVSLAACFSTTKFLVDTTLLLWSFQSKEWAWMLVVPLSMHEVR